MLLDRSFPEIKERYRDILSERQIIHIKSSPDRKLSAVLIPVFYKEGQNYMLFTRRSELVRFHKGEISFPGGGFHADDGTLLNTALRESQEEIGLAPDDVEIVGELDDIITRFSNFIVSPFIGLIRPDYPFKISKFEIAELIEIPIDALLDDNSCRLEPYAPGPGEPYHPHVYHNRDKKITGATAAILKHFLEIYSRIICTLPPT